MPASKEGKEKTDPANYRSIALSNHISKNVLSDQNGVKDTHTLPSYLSTSYLSILTNTDKSQPFDLQYGVGCSDPLSPLLFDIALEPLANRNEPGEFIC